MEFGKSDILGLNQIDLSLPSDDPRSWTALKRAKDRHSLAGATPTFSRIGVGAPGWGVKDWVGKVYPVGTLAKDFLFHYSRQFNSVELNSTFYGIPDSETIERWQDSTPNDFKFNVKMLQDITHRGPLTSDPGLLREYIASIMGLEDRLGFVFVQLPPSFSPRDTDELGAFFKMLPSGLNVAVEARHAGFYADHRLTSKFFDLLQSNGASAVITDVTGRRDVLHTSLPTSKVMVRFLGNDLHPSDDSRIADWAARIHTWLILGLEQIEFFVHQPENRAAPETIARLTDLLNQECGANLRKWKPAQEQNQLELM
jgi:uncharacterized protein YecE (DUF72 family)